MGRRLAALAFSLAFVLAGLFAERIDLGKTVYYARRGFDPNTIVNQPAPGEGGWLAIAHEKGQSLAVRNFHLDGMTMPGIMEFEKQATDDFTIACVFEADLALINTTGLSVMIPQAGQGWALYLNGAPLYDELYRARNGGLSPERTLRDVIVTLDKRSLRLGSNVLAFHINGDPSDELTGLAGGRSIIIDSYARLFRQGGEYLDIALIGVYALFALYHFILFALRPKNRTYSIFGLGAFLFSAFLFARSQTAAILLSDTAILRVIEYACLFLSLPIIVAFCETALRSKVSVVSKLGLISSIVLSCLLPFYRHEPLRVVWEALVAIQLLILFAFHLVPRLVARIRGKGSARRPRFGQILVSDESLLFLGTLVFAASLIADMLSVATGLEFAYSKYAFVFFVLGAAAILASQFVGVYVELEELRESLERKVVERSAQIATSIENQRGLGEEIVQQGLRLSNAADVAERDLEIAARVQRGFFPSSPPEVEGWDLALAFRPAAKVSGDFFDFYVEGSRLSGLVVGDVSGHGMGAGLVSVLARSVFGRRYFENRKLPLGDLLGLVHADLETEIGAVDEYLTCLILRLEGGRIEYANAAHPDLLYRRAGAEKAVAVLPRGQDGFRGPVLGKSGFAGGWSALRFVPGPGDLLLAYTDCLEEAKNGSGERYGRERLLESLAKADATSAADALNSILIDIEGFCDSRHFDDDLTAIVLKRLS